MSGGITSKRLGGKEEKPGMPSHSTVNDDGPPLGVRDWIVLLLACALGVVVASCHPDSMKIYRSTPRDVPLVVQTFDAFPNASFDELAACAKRSALLGENPLGGAFSATRGLVARFRSDGLADVEARPELECLLPFYDEVKVAGANAFVLNVVVCEATLEDPGARRDPIGWHIDQSFPVRFAAGWYVAETVTVLYIDVPEDMNGGELELAKFPDDWLDRHGLDARRAYRDSDLGDDVLHFEHAKVTPVENKLVRFRGDAHHRVLPFATSVQGGTRVSLVLEQYRLPAIATAWGRTRRFSINAK